MFPADILRNAVVLFAMMLLFAWLAIAVEAGPVPDQLITAPRQLDTGLTGRAISFENPIGTPGEGGKGD